MAGFQIGQFVSGGGSSVLIAVPAGSLVLTGYAPSVRTPRTVQVPVASLTLTGYAPTVLTPRRVLVPVASLVLTGYAPTVVVPATIPIPAGSLVLTGYAPAVVVAVTVQVPAASLTLTGYAPTVVIPATTPIPAGSLVLTGYAPTVRTPRVVLVPVASLVLTGYAPTVVTPRVITVPAGSLILTGYAPTVQAGAATVQVPVGLLVLTGYAPDVLASATVADTGIVPAGSAKRGRKPKQYFVEWRGKLYKVSGEREGLELLRKLRADESAKLARMVPVLAKRAVKHIEPPPVDPPQVTVSGDAPIAVVQAAEQAQRALAEEYRREVETAYIHALEWRIARLSDDNDGLLALLVGSPGAGQSDAMARATDISKRIYEISRGQYNVEAKRIYIDTLAWQATWLADENETLEALVLDDD